ncbi:uncharacterized protein LOC141641488 [Silene latifolia]|uniref:uncharacterized protein LOC141641488 n=1 Tax=Silene latifolia TaxID=37657 RepID=UPI003D782FAC
MSTTVDSPPAANNNQYDDPTFVSNSDYAGMQLVNPLFNGKNFLSWSRSILMALSTKNKQGFLTGTVSQPAITSSQFPRWLRADSMVRCWLLNSMIPTIKEGYLSCKSAKLLWTDVCERYGQSNAPRLYQLKKDLKNITQDDVPVVEYFNKLKRHWDDIDELEEIPECVCGAMVDCSCNLQKRILDASIREKVLTFLMGLNDVYDSLRTNILAMDPIPPINKTYSIVQQIESQKIISNVIVSSQDASALNASKHAGKQPWNVWKRGEPKGDPNKKPKVDDRWCPHCNKKGHVIDSCFIKHPELKEKFLARFAGKFSGNVTSGQPEGQYSGYHNQPQYQGQGQAGGQFPASHFPASGYPSGYFSDQGKASTSAQHQAFSTSQMPPGPSSAMQFDPAMLTALYHHMMQLQQAKQDNPLDNSDASVNFAGITLASNVQSHDSCNDWIIDSGASDHMSANKSFFTDLRVLPNPILIGLPDGSTQLVTHGGDICLKSGLTLHNALFVPVFKHNLLSVGKLLCTTNLLIHFFVDKCIIQDPASECPVAIGFQDKGLYKLHCPPDQRSHTSCYNTHVNKLSHSETVDCCNCSSSARCKAHANLDNLHARLGHASLSKMQHVDVINCKGLKTFDCEACFQAKIHRFPFPRSVSRATKIFELIHVDLWGPYKSPTLTGAYYFLTIVDDHSRVTWTFLLKTKTQVCSTLENFFAQIENIYHTSVKTLRSDNGTEVIQDTCLSLLNRKGIIHQKSVPGVPQQNGRVERKHRHLVETARAMLLHAKLPKKFWGESILTATYLINKLPTPILDWKSPSEVLMGKLPTFDELRIFGCQCFAPIHTQPRDKFGPKGRKCIFIGYPFGQKAYKLYDLETHKIFVSRDVIFQEDVFPFAKALSKDTSSSQSSLSFPPPSVPIFEQDDIEQA